MKMTGVTSTHASGIAPSPKLVAPRLRMISVSMHVDLLPVTYWSLALFLEAQIVCVMLKVLVTYVLLSTGTSVLCSRVETSCLIE